MKIKILAISICFILICFSIKANEYEDFLVEESEYTITFPIDTTNTIVPVKFNKDTHTKFKEQKEYNYDYRPEPNKTSWSDAFNRWLRDNMSINLSKKQLNSIVITLFIVLGLLLIILLYFFKPSLFYFNKKQHLDFTLEDEDFENLNFDNLIRKSIEDNQYNDAIRWCYLSILKTLHEKNYISYDPNKTVNEYTFEIKKEELKTIFRKLSYQFIYFRYGNGNSNRSSFEKFNLIANQLRTLL